MKKKEEVEYEVSISELLSSLKKKKGLWKYLILAVILVSAFVVRTGNVPYLRDKVLLALDPFVFYRYANYIVSGGLPANDELRYYPNGFDTKAEAPMPSYAVAFMYLFLKNFFPGLKLITVAIYYPTIFGVLSLLVFYFLTREFSKNNITALCATAFLASVPSFLYRTTAGFTEKESVASVFIFLSLLLFLKIIKNKGKKKYIYAALSGLATGLAGMSWGGFIFVVMAISLYVVAMVFFANFEREDFFGLIIWFALMVLPIFTLTHRFGGITDMFKHVAFIIPSFAIACAAVFVLLKDFLEKKGVPAGFTSIILACLVSAALGLVVNYDYASGFILGLSERLKHPMGTDAFTQSVSENQPPFFYDPIRGVDWWHDFSWFFFFFLLGSVLLFLDIAAVFGKQRLLVTGAFTVFISFFIFSNFSSDQKYRQLSEIFSGYYLHSLAIFGVFVLYLYLKEHKEHRKRAANLKKESLLLLSWFIVLVVGARAAVRILFALSAPAMILAAYCLVKGDEMIKKLTNDKVYRSVPYILVFVLVSWSFPNAYARNKLNGPSFNIFYEMATDWMKNNTASDAVFTHWWDYGYWIQTMGERTTTVDGGNYHFWRNYLNARYFMCGYNDSDRMMVLEKFGNPNYLFIVDDDIFKFYQMARIGERNTHFDALQYTGLYENPFKDVNKTEWPKVAVYEGGVITVKEDMLVGSEFYDGDQTYVTNVFLFVNNGTFGSGKAVTYNPVFGQKAFDLDCVCEEYKGCSDIGEFPACVLIIEGGLIFIPKKTLNMTFTQLYLLRQNMTMFDLVYENEVPINLQTIGNNFYTNIRIYEIRYNETGAGRA